MGGYRRISVIAVRLALDRAPTIIELIVGLAREIGRNLLSHQLDLSGRPQIKLEGLSLETAASEGGARQSLSLDSLDLVAGTVSTRTYDRGAEADLGLSIEAQVGLGPAVEAG